MGREEIEMKLAKVDELEAKLMRLENEIIQINKRITKLQDNKRDCKSRGFEE